MLEAVCVHEGSKTSLLPDELLAGCGSVRHSTEVYGEKTRESKNESEMVNNDTSI